MPYTASSVQGLPDESLQQPHSPVARGHDGVRGPGTAAVCRHLLGDVFDVPGAGLPTLEQAALR